MPAGERERLEDLEEEMARIGDLALRVKMFLYYTVSSYAFFVYAMGVMSFILLGIALARITGLDDGLVMGVSIFSGITVSTVAFMMIMSKMMVAGSWAGRAEASRAARKSMLFVVAQYLISLSIVYWVIDTLAPDKTGLLWHPALALFLLTFYMVNRQSYAVPHLIAATIMFLFEPIVFTYPDSLADVGSFVLAYFVAGLYSVWRGLQELGG